VCERNVELAERVPGGLPDDLTRVPVQTKAEVAREMAEDGERREAEKVALAEYAAGAQRRYDEWAARRTS
jgi:hypothetical protein